MVVKFPKRIERGLFQTKEKRLIKLLNLRWEVKFPPFLFVYVNYFLYYCTINFKNETSGDR